MFKKILKSKRGEMYVEGVVTFIIIIALLVFSMSVLKVSPVKSRIDLIADRLLETATHYGCFGTEFAEEVAYLQEAYPNMEFTVSYDGEWYNATLQRVQLGDKMTVTVSCEVTLGALGSFVTIPLTSVRSGASENYWKNT